MPSKTTPLLWCSLTSSPHVQARQHGQEPSRCTLLQTHLGGEGAQQTSKALPSPCECNHTCAVSQCHAQPSTLLEDFANFMAVYHRARRAVSSYLEQLWEARGPSSTAAATLAGLRNYKPSWAQYLRKSWHLYRACKWLKAEPVCRATPMPSLVALGMAGAAYKLGVFQLTMKDIRLVQSKVLVSCLSPRLLTGMATKRWHLTTTRTLVEEGVPLVISCVTAAWKQTLLKGRWASSRTARMYLASAASAYARLTLTDTHTIRLTDAILALPVEPS
eukprot:3867006-Amphidinium_carterae.3